ncbi:malectin domain-containing carbohydrate-binding protein [Croceimicrobium hydrocarbonivorans]|uniref:T9SS type A sorting domain-containing protein n=1 Tax=Croceimicrobium hydrocarbonivorans TaxID=2761580 RepID=A0A7H0VCF4_9FLAO|nr:malectin domain-containing carbohydrate-binding protein [Croceimicrobium hydrocarbonivorans]QNR23402.1 T9SS type A sorting domain-containing protein [Croceimicrobium hydrocarbonivorans]
MTFTLPAQVNFSSGGLSGVSITNPTSLDFGPDGRLYVSVQSGEIYAYTVQRQSNGTYQVLSTETILAIKQIQNHNDDGTLHATVQRQITGLLVDGTAGQPIIYVASSDYRIGGGGGGSDKNLDSNSGMISKLIWDGTTWQRIDLVRGLARSEENHATNGLQLDKQNNILYIAAGGNTNAGSPSNNFAFLNEYALSAAILSVDLNVLDAMPVLTDAQGAQYVYDLPTLDDPTRANANGIDDPNQAGYDGIDINDPFGGNDGLNQAKWVVNGPVQVYASGFRNAYDIVLMEDGRMYTWDNGANQGWGGHPDNEGVGTATNKWVVGEPGSTGPGPNDAMVNNKDGLHFISGAGYYGGHPNPVRANPLGAGLFTHDHADGAGGQNGVWRTQITTNVDSTLPVDWPPVDPSLAHPIEGDFQNAGVDDASLYTITASTNGLARYPASNFNGEMENNLLAASFNGNIYRVKLNAQGTLNSNSDVSVLATGFGAVPLDVTAQADDEIFPGTIWAATYGSNAITIFEPQDFSSCTGVYSTSLDEDNDGYSNADEMDNGTNPCSGASFPADNDQSLIGGYKVSDLNDPDDDDDGLADSLDYFALDASNGAGLSLAFDYPLLNGDPGFGLYGLGFTGFMSNQQEDYLDLYYHEDNSATEIIAGGAVGLLSFNDVPEGSPVGPANSLKNGFQFGMDLAQAQLPFEIETALVGPIFQGNPQGDQFHAFYIGKGDQDNFILYGIRANNGNPMLSIWIEENGGTSRLDYALSGLTSAAEISLYLELNPLSQSIQAKINLGNGKQDVGSAIAFPSFLQNLFQNQEALAIGVAAGKSSGTASFNATYDFIKANFQANTLSGDWSFVHDGSNCQWNGGTGSCPQGRHEASYVQAGKYFVLIGGREHGSNANLYDPSTGLWKEGAAPPFNLHHYQAVELDGLIYAVAGMTGSFPNEQPLSHIYIYDPLADAWHQGAEIPASRRRGSAGVVVYQDKIYVLGGIQQGHISGWVPWFDAYDPHTNTWSTLADAPRERDHFHALVANGKLYAAGGRKTGFSGTFGATIPEVDVYDFASSTWSTLPNNLPNPQAGASVALIGNELILIGGENSSSQASNLSQALNLSDASWRYLDTLNVGRHGTQAIVNQQAIYLASGSPNQGGGQLESHEVFSFGAVQSPSLQADTRSVLSGPIAIDFGSLAAGQNAQSTFYLKSKNGTQALIIDSLSLATADFNWQSNYTFPIHLAAGDSLAINLSAVANQTSFDTLKVYSTASNSEFSIPVSVEVETVDAIRINCGGPQYQAQNGNLFEGDNYFLNGSNYSTQNSISGTQDEQIYQTERWASNLAYSIPVEANGRYQLNLHFAEIYAPNFVTGARVFDINAEGQLIDAALDIYDTVGGYTAHILSYSVEINDGSLDLSLVGLADNAKLSAIELMPSAAGLELSASSYHFQTLATGSIDSATLSINNASSQLLSIDSIRVQGAQASDFSHNLNAGTAIPSAYSQNIKVYFHPQGSVPVVRSAQMQIYYGGEALPLILNLSGEAACPAAGLSCDDGNPTTLNDTTDGSCNCAGEVITPPAFSLNINCGGGALVSPVSGKSYLADQYNIGGYTHSYSDGVANTQDSALYSTARIGRNMSYNIPVPQAGTYEVRLHFAELQKWLMGSGRRVFDISLEGQLVFDDLDIYNLAGGGAKAYSATATVVVTDGVLNIQTAASVDNSVLVAIDLSSYNPSYQDPYLSQDQLSISTTVGGQDSASFYWLNADGQSRQIDSLRITGNAAAYVQSQIAIGQLVNAGDSILGYLHFQAPSQAFSGSAKIWYYSNSDSLEQDLSVQAQCLAAGTTCDDGDASTQNDIEDGNCNCAGTPINPGPSEFSININCGGAALTSPITGKVYLADQYNIGGYTHSYSNGVANTQDSALFSTARIGRNMSYHVPLPESGEYEISLHFAELQGWLMGAGRRVFDISVEGNLIIDDLDIFTAAGGGASAYTETFKVNVNDGQLDINTAASVDNSLLVAIEIRKTSTMPVASRNWYLSDSALSITMAAGALDSLDFYVVNKDTVARTIDSVLASGNALSYLQFADISGHVISAGDSLLQRMYFQAPSQNLNQASAELYYYSAGDMLQQNILLNSSCPAAGLACDDGDSSTQNDISDGNCGCSGQPVNQAFSINVNCGGPAHISPITGISYLADQYNIGGYTHSYTKGVANTQDSTLYSTCRIGRNMAYYIPVPEPAMYEVTLHFAELQGWLMGPARRVFDISAEGQLVLDDIDIYSLSGDGATAYSTSFPVEVLDGELALNTAASVDNSLLVAIEVKAGASAKTSLGMQQSELQTSIYPNPLGQGQSLHLELPNDKEVQVQIFNLQGALIFQSSLRGSYRYELADLNLNSGLYLLRLNQGASASEHKLMVP